MTATQNPATGAGETPGNRPPTETKNDFCDEVRRRVAEVVVGQDVVVERILIALFTGGHLMLQGVPGLAKTLLVNAVAKAIDLEFARIQFTIDMLPSDVVGAEILDQKTGDFRVRQGPVFTNLLLAQQHDCLVLHFRDPAETGLRGAGLFRGREAESGRAFYASGLRRWLTDCDLRRRLTRHGIDYLLLRTDRPMLASLRSLLKARGRTNAAR